MLVLGIITSKVHIFLKWQYKKSTLMRLLIRYLHIKGMVSGMEVDISLRVHSVEIHKRMNLKVERNVLPFTQWKALSLTSSPVIAVWMEVRGIRSVPAPWGSAPFWRSGIHLSSWNTWGRRRWQRGTTEPGLLIRDRAGPPDSRPRQWFGAACPSALLWALLEVERWKGRGTFILYRDA